MNSVLFHPSLLHVVTAGIEQHVILHSPTRSSPCVKDLTLTPTTVRELPAGSPEDHSRYLRAISTGLGTNDFEEDTDTIAMFDEYVSDIMVADNLTGVLRIIRTEGTDGRDIFSSWGCEEDSESDSEDDEVELI